MDSAAHIAVPAPSKPLRTAHERGLRALFGGYRAAVSDRLDGQVKSSWLAGNPIIPVMPPEAVRRMLHQGLNASGRRMATVADPAQPAETVDVAVLAEAAGLKTLLLAPAGLPRPEAPGEVVEIPDPAFVAARLQFQPEPDPFEPDPQPKRRRLLVSFHDPHDAARWEARAKDVTYLEFLRWEMAEWFDREHPKFMVRGFPLRSGVRSDDNRATLDTVMLMRHFNHVRMLDAPPHLDAVVAAMAHHNPLLVTTQPALALFGISRQLPTIFVPLTEADHARFHGLGFGGLTTEPYRFRADLASAMIVAIHSDQQTRQDIATARKALAATADAAQRAIAAWLA